MEPVGPPPFLVAVRSGFEKFPPASKLVTEPAGPPLAVLAKVDEPLGPPPSRPINDVTAVEQGPTLSVESRKRTWGDSHNENVNTVQERADELNEDDEQFEPAFVYEAPKFASLVETDSNRLSQRQKQIDLGKNTVGYQNYLDNVPRNYRQRFNKIHPVTPDIKDVCSKRCFDGKIRAWRRQLHLWDVLPGQQANHKVMVATAKRIKMTPQSEDSPQEAMDIVLQVPARIDGDIFDDL